MACFPRHSCPLEAFEVHVILDMRTLFFAGAVICIAVAGIMVYYSFVRKIYPGFRHWTFGFSAAGVGSFFLAFRGSIPDYISIILANMLIAAMPFMLAYGIAILSEIQWRLKFFYLTMFFLFSILLSYATYINQNINVAIPLTQHRSLGLTVNRPAADDQKLGQARNGD